MVPIPAAAGVARPSSLCTWQLHALLCSPCPMAPSFSGSFARPSSSLKLFLFLSTPAAWGCTSSVHGNAHTVPPVGPHPLLWAPPLFLRPMATPHTKCLKLNSCSASANMFYRKRSPFHSMASQARKTLSPLGLPFFSHPHPIQNWIWTLSHTFPQSFTPWAPDPVQPSPWAPSLNPWPSVHCPPSCH